MIQEAVTPRERVQEPLRVSVLASGTVLLDGRPVTFSELEPAFAAAKHHGAPVLYYRESGALEPPPEAQKVLQLIVANKLAISLSSRPDFSDWVDQQGISHLRNHVPAAPPQKNPEEVFAKARSQAATARQIVIVRPDLQYLLLPVPPPGSMKPEATKSVEAMIPSATPRRVAVIADTSFAAAPKPPTLQEVSFAIPFFGLLIGFGYVGHAVCVLGPDPAIIQAGCRDADILVLDSIAIPKLPKGWEEPLPQIMRNENLIAFDRASQKFFVAKTAGWTKGKIEFPR